MKNRLLRWLSLRAKYLSGGFIVILSACGGGGVIPLPGQNVRALEADFISRVAIAYSPYRTAQNESGLAAEAIPLSNIKQDLLLLRQAGFGAIRIFDASDKVAKQTVQAIRELNLDMKVMLGVWLTTDNNPASATLNADEIKRAVALANANPEIINAISVGNETQVSWNTRNPQSISKLVEYIKVIRSQVRQPVTTDDNWAFFAQQSGQKDPRPVLNEIDFVSMHSYPLLDTIYNPNLWDWKQVAVPANQRAKAMVDAALARAKLEYEIVRGYMDQTGYAQMPILVGETGWKASPSGGETSRAHPVNQKMYFEGLQAWKKQGGPKTIVYFSAFDEAWKQGDDKWGLFNAQRQARCAAQALNNTLTPEPGSCDAAQALYYNPPAN